MGRDDTVAVDVAIKNLHYRLTEHKERMDKMDERSNQQDAKLDRITWLIVVTLTTVCVNFGYILVNGR